MVYIGCQHGGKYSPPGDKPLGVVVREFLDWVS